MKAAVILVVTSLAMASMAQTATQFATGSSFAGTGVNTGVGAQTTIDGTGVNPGVGTQTPIVGTGVNNGATTIGTGVNTGNRPAVNTGAQTVFNTGSGGNVNAGAGINAARQAQIVNQIMLAQIAAAAAAQQAVPNAMNAGSFDRAFLRKATADSMLEVVIARIARTNSENAAVQQLAEKLEVDHTAMVQQIQQLADSLDIDLPQELRQDQQQRAFRASALVGDRFDRAFLRFVIQMHEADLRLFQRAAVSARSPEVRTFAREALPLLTEHLVLALEARETLVAREATGSPVESQ
jgi:putative membrane protein